ncbi:reverse transcriptase family protein [Undibacterium parvum]|uniref:RNA-directed DNA polymerase n=2 Tax=Undibacterium TaxID=401469 RepID=A0A6M4A0A6_9BURK|nr:reverse transcriptase family protein [Undibacterium parvum]QJQ04563.1 RNA-directed DNA polymerase [Undibacterium piscinae]
MEIRRLDALNLPPVSSRQILGLMFGLNSGLIWSFQSRTHRYYRTFNIPKGNRQRRIDAPCVGLKAIQKWLATQLQGAYKVPDHVFGFVAGRSHIDAASVHAQAVWVLSVDIRDFFQTTPKSLVKTRLLELGFLEKGAELIASLCCLRDNLAQGAPTSPLLSNVCFIHVDQQLSYLADKYNLRLSRYADDIVFSGKGQCPDTLRDELESLFIGSTWVLAPEKTELVSLPKRLKVHGLLVHGENIRLTKGYRNKIRTYKHLLATKGAELTNSEKIKGHISYEKYVDLVVDAQRNT